MSTPEDRYLAHGIRDFVTQMKRRLRKTLSNPEQLSVAELNVVSLLMDAPEMRPSELGEQLHISSQFMSQVLNRLHELGYISRKPSPADRRKMLVSLTQRGRNKVLQTRQEREDWLTELIARRYTAEEKATIQRAIELLSILPNL